MAQAWRGIHYAEAYAALNPGTDATYILTGGGSAVFISESSPVNKAIGLGLQGPVSDEDIETIEKFFLNRGAKPFIATCPLAHPSLIDHLYKSGYHVCGLHNVFARNLTVDFQPFQTPYEMRITPANNDDGQLWLKISAQGFDGTENPPHEVLEILGPNYYAPSSACYFAWINGQPAAAAGMYFHENVVELGGASTLPAFRRCGAQRALINERLIRAREIGCNLAVILTEPGSNSERNTLRAGFELAYTQVHFQKQC